MVRHCKPWPWIYIYIYRYEYTDWLLNSGCLKHLSCYLISYRVINLGVTRMICNYTNIYCYGRLRIISWHGWIQIPIMHVSRDILMRRAGDHYDSYDGQAWDEFSLDNISTSFVRITVMEVYDTLNNGFNELEFYTGNSELSSIWR